VIIAVDPGLAHTGVVVWDACIKDVHTFTTKGAGHKVDPASAITRCSYIAESVCSFVSNGDTVVIESYTDIGGGTYRQAANRWTTPMLIGYLVRAVEDKGGVVVLQRADIVMKQCAAYKQAWANGIVGIIKGDSLIAKPTGRRGNDHERSAGAHLAYYISTNHGKS
jgi:hypothetical protein